MIEPTILANLLHNEKFTRKAIPYLKPEYFDDPSSRVIFDTYQKYFEKYNGLPSSEAMLVSLDNRRDLNEASYKEAVDYFKTIKYDSKTDQEWLLNETETFCREKSVFLALRKCITIIDGKDKTLDAGAIPKIMEDALAVSFDNSIGHNYTEDADARYEYYHKEESRIPFDLGRFNDITQGGLPPKSLTCFIGGTGTGKSLVKCHMAAAHYMMGKNVLYVTLELAEEEVSRRIDANLLDVQVQDVKDMPKEEFDRKIARIKSKTTGSLTVKEYPTGAMNANNLRFILEEMWTKQGIKIDVVYLDYINLCNSYRIKNVNANSYTIVKSVAEEMRGLAMEYDIPVITSTQPNRSGMESSDMQMTDVSESVGLIFTLDALFALHSNDELSAMGQMMIKQLKNRWGDLNRHNKFLIGIDRAKMRLYDLEDSAQEKIKVESVSAKGQEVSRKTKKKLESNDIT